MDQHLLIFDGECAFCARCLAWLQRRDKHNRIFPMPFQAPEALERAAITLRQAQTEIWLVSGERKLSGAAAASASLDVALGTGMFLRIYRAPGIGRIQEAIYRWVARNRYRLTRMSASGSKPSSC